MNLISYSNSFYLNKSFLLHNSTLMSPYNFLMINKILATATIRDTSIEKNANFPRNKWLLEHVSTQKTFSKNYKIKRVGRNERRVVFSISVANRKLRAVNFLYFFLLFVLPNFRRKLLRMSKKLNIFGNFFFLVKDISVFPGYLETFFKWRYFLHFNVELKPIKKYPTRRGIKINNKYLLQDFGLRIR